MDVPIQDWKPPPGTEDTIYWPGARSERNEAELEKDEMVSALGALVVDPTLMALEMHPGEDRLVDDPLFPAATTTAMPTERNVSMMDFVAGSSASQTAVEE